VNPENFDEDYYLRGPQTGKSNYENYSWKGELTIPYAKHLVRHLGIRQYDSILDFGCARGYLVRALKEIGYNAVGYDISEWAVENCDEAVKGLVFNQLPSGLGPFDWIHCKDVLEHTTPDEMMGIIIKLMPLFSNGMLIIVPLTHRDGGEYIYDADSKDSSHIIRWTLETWIKFITKITDSQLTENFTISGGYHMYGLKPASITHRQSTGFITIKKYQ